MSLWIPHNRDSKGNLRYYYSDFIVEMKDKHVIVETKGEVDVTFKDRRAKNWCEDSERVTGEKWVHIRVNEAGFYKYYFDCFEEVIHFFISGIVGDD